MKGTRALELAPKYKVPSRVSFFTRFCLLGFLGFSFPVGFTRYGEKKKKREREFEMGEYGEKKKHESEFEKEAFDDRIEGSPCPESLAFPL
jgi:hypothetical protein